MCLFVLIVTVARPKKLSLIVSFYFISFPPFFFLGWHSLGTTQEEAARRQQILDANRAERAKRAERKANKANGIDRPAQSDDENRDIGLVKLSIFQVYIPP